MLGAIAGDVIGSVFEHRPVKSADFELFSDQSRFTDDSVLTVAVADAILSGREYGQCLQDWGLRYPRAGYGQSFFGWLHADDPRPYGSWGNGSAMRVSPVGFHFDDEEEVLKQAARSAAVSHDHPEGIKGAQAVALAIWMARRGEDKRSIRARISEGFDYDLDRRLDEIRPGYRFDVSCQGSVPEAILAFLESDDFESAIRNAVSLGGDADTQACMAGGIAEAFYGEVPGFIRDEVLERLPTDMIEVMEGFKR